MKTLIMRFAAPLQSWGSDSKFEARRTTQREPTKSGVVGLLAAALGRERNDPIDDLASMAFGIRIDQVGQLLVDYHTARNEKDAFVTRRYYLSDAVFVVGLEGPDSFLWELHSALEAPVFPLFLGRRSCPPVGRISLGIRDLTLYDALCSEPWQASDWYRAKLINKNSRKERNDGVYLTLVLDSARPGNLRRRDLPLSFSQQHRKYGYRYVDDNPRGVRIAIGVEAPEREEYATEHDAFGGGDTDVLITD